MSNEQTVKIINQDKFGDYCLAVRGRKLVVNFSNPGDPYQRWIKKDYNDKKDQDTQQAFALINEATNEAIKLDGTTVSLVRYNLLDGTSEEKLLLLTMSKDSDKNFRRILRATNTSYHITPKDFNVEDGRRVEMRSENLRAAFWKFVKDSVDTVPGSAGGGPGSADVRPDSAGGRSGARPGSTGVRPDSAGGRSGARPGSTGGSSGAGPGSTGGGPGSTGGSSGAGPGNAGTGPGGAGTCCGQSERSNNVAP